MNSKIISILLVLLGTISILYNPFLSLKKKQTTEFERWKAKFNVKFKNDFQEKYRERVYLENVAKINAHNANQHKTYTQGVNQFTALTQEQFIQLYLGTIIPVTVINTNQKDDITVGDVDWTSQGVVTPVKDQGPCGSCWAFSATGALQGLSKIAYGTLQSFSEQQLVDCSGSYGNYGCNGGLMDNAFKYVKDKGILLEDDYQYKAITQVCSKNGGKFKISSFTDVNNCNDLANSLTARPISVAVDASNWSAYQSGIFNRCGSMLNHGVLLVGVTKDYWRIKNSWAQTWGQKGFMRLSRGNTCGICNAASYPNK